MMSLPAVSCILAALVSSGAPQGGGEAKGGRKKPQEKPKWLVELPEGFVQYARVPEGGRFPRLAQRDGSVALLYLAAEGPELRVSRSADEAATFLPALSVDPSSAPASSSDQHHSGGIALGPDGRACVAWIRAGDTQSLHFRQEGAGGWGEVVDLGSPEGLCGNAAVCIDGDGRIYVAYAAGRAVQGEGPQRTSGVRVWLRRSMDGQTFTEPVAIDREDDGYSPLSQMAIHADEVMGTIFVLYRAGFFLKEGDPVQSRCMRLLSSEDHGESFDSGLADNWKQRKDPASSASLSQERNTTLASWETGEKVYWSLVRRQLNKVNLPVEAKDEERLYRRTHAAAAASEREVLLAWLERPKDDPTAEPTVAWQVWLIEGRLPQGAGHAPESGSSGPVVLARKSGGFTLVY